VLRHVPAQLRHLDVRRDVAVQAENLKTKFEKSNFQANFEKSFFHFKVQRVK
jgi:hypothetical protein